MVVGLQGYFEYLETSHPSPQPESHIHKCLKILRCRSDDGGSNDGLSIIIIRNFDPALLMIASRVHALIGSAESVVRVNLIHQDR